MTTKWWQSSVVYQIYPRSFMDSNGDGVGDLQGILSKLDYLAHLGVDVIWLSPVYKSPMKDNGYDIADYQAIAPEFGTLADMDALLEKAGAKGIRIIMDLVVNHTSSEHPWFLEAKKSTDNPYRDYYIWRSPGEDGGPPNDMTATFGGSAWAYDAASQMYYFHLFDASQPDLNWDNPKVHEEVHKMMNWWLDRGIGGFRMDVIDLIGKNIDEGITANGPTLHAHLQAMHKAAFAKKDVLTVGETWGASPDIAKLYSASDRDELSMIFQFEHIAKPWNTDMGKWTTAKPTLAETKKIFIKWQEALSDSGWNSLFWNNHDLPRVVSWFGDDKEAHRHLSAKMLATLLHMMKGTPYIYQGEELGMTNTHFQSIEACNDVETLNFYHDSHTPYTPTEKMAVINTISRDHARTPMQWSDKPHGGFTTGTPWLEVNPNYTTINADAALADPSSIFYHYKQLIALRKEMPVVVHGTFHCLDPDEDSTFCYTRRDHDHELLVVNNLTPEPVSVTLPKRFDDGQGSMRLSNYPDTTLQGTMILRPYESFVYCLS